jgi:hypothetical protein
MDRSAHTPRADVASHANGNATPRFDIFQPGPGLALVGAGLLALAGVEGARLVLTLPSTETQALLAADQPEAPLGAAMTSEVFFEPAAPFDPQSAVGTGPGAPKVTSKGVPSASGQLVGMAANPIPNGTAIYRLWSSGRVEAMISTEQGLWGEWVPVAPGLSTDMRRPQAPKDNPDVDQP